VKRREGFFAVKHKEWKQKECDSGLPGLNANLFTDQKIIIPDNLSSCCQLKFPETTQNPHIRFARLVDQAAPVEIDTRFFCDRTMNDRTIRNTNRIDIRDERQ